jgi:hypothetical protein
MQTLIIEISGGVVQEVYSDARDLRVIKIDWDSGDSPGDQYCGGQLVVQPTSALPDETREAIAVLVQ